MLYFSPSLPCLFLLKPEIVTVFNIFFFAPLLTQPPIRRLRHSEDAQRVSFLVAHAHDRSEYTPGGGQTKKMYHALRTAIWPSATFQNLLCSLLIRKMQIKLLILKAYQKDVQSAIPRTRDDGNGYFFEQKKKTTFPRAKFGFKKNNFFTCLYSTTSRREENL